MKPTVFLFGEAEKGEYCVPHLCRSVGQLMENFGNPPDESLGIFYAVQTLMYNKDLVFFRVKEEGFSIADYKKGLKLLHIKESIPILSAIYLPGIGDQEVIHEVSTVCQIHKSLMVLTEKDLYDFLTVI